MSAAVHTGSMAEHYPPLQASNNQAPVIKKTGEVVANRLFILSLLALCIIGWMGVAGKFPATYLSPTILGLTCLAVITLARKRLYAGKSFKSAVITSLITFIIPLLAGSLGIAGTISLRTASWMTAGTVGIMIPLYIATCGCCSPCRSSQKRGKDEMVSDEEATRVANPELADHLGEMVDDATRRVNLLSVRGASTDTVRRPDRMLEEEDEKVATLQSTMV